MGSQNVSAKPRTTRYSMRENLMKSKFSNPRSPVQSVNLELSYGQMTRLWSRFSQTCGMAKRDLLNTVQVTLSRSKSKTPGLISLELQLLNGCKIIFPPLCFSRELEAVLSLYTETQSATSRHILVEVLEQLIMQV